MAYSTDRRRKLDVAADPTPPLPSSSPAVPVTAPATVPSTAVDTPVKPEPTRKPQNVTINLINRLVERGVLSKEDAADLIKQAEEDALEARAQTNAIPATQTLNPPLPSTDENGTLLAPVAVADISAEAEDTVRVTYIPETVKAQLREEIKQEVLDQAREERWAVPRSFPEWVSRVRPFADLRVRYEGDFFPKGNDNTGAFPNFNALNTGPPFDIAGSTFSPQLNVAAQAS